MDFLLLALKRKNVNGTFYVFTALACLRQGLAVAISCLPVQLSLLWGLQAQERYQAVLQGILLRLYIVYILHGLDAVLGGPRKDRPHDQLRPCR